jgi:[ribosomal protein S18]-alanine N-acetyltransferase
MRALKPEDALWLSALHAECFDEKRRWSADLIASFLQSPAARGLAYINSEQPVAFILWQSAAGEAEITTLATLPSQRRKGIAAKLVKEFIKASGASRFFLEVAENNHAAIALYTQLGFEKTGQRANYYREDGGSIHAWIMQKSLPIS